MKLKLYYRGYINKLHQVNADGVEDINEAIKALEEDLNEAGDFFQPPILALIKGGKA